MTSPSRLSVPSLDRAWAMAPGVAAVGIVSAVSVAIGSLEGFALGRPVIEPLVVALLLGMVVRAAGRSDERLGPGVRFVAKDVLEAAVFLLGATMDVPRLFASGPRLAVGIAVLVSAAVVSGYVIGRAVGLSAKLAMLVACGNAICGNSAIAAVAPVIGADHDDVAASIALTAVVGVAVVLTLPALIPLLGLSNYQYGVLAGLTVYAVPQVLAAAFAVSALSGQIATAVKLARVLMLGPVVTVLALIARRARGPMPPLRTLVPWFVFGFVVLAALRSAGVISDGAGDVAKLIAGWLTIAAMAALGLSVDVRSVRRVGARVVVAVAGSLAVLVVFAVALIRVIGVR